MMFFIWIMPYVDSLNHFMTDYILVNGNPMYVFINLYCSSVIQFYLGRNFYISAYKSLKHSSANMDVLIVIGTTSSLVYGIILILIGYTKEDSKDMMQFGMHVHAHVHNFETSAFIICIVLLGKYIETFSKMKTVDKLSELASLKVTKANLILQKNPAKINLNCKHKEIPVELLEIKDYVLV